MRVLHISFGNIYDPVGGLNVHLRNLCEELKEFDDLKITVVNVDYQNQGGGLFLKGEHLQEVEFKNWVHKPKHYRVLSCRNYESHNLKDGFIQLMTTIDLMHENILECLGHEEFDLIHIHDTHLWKVGKNLKALFKCPILLSVHLNILASHPEQKSGLDDPRCRYRIETELYGTIKADHIHTVSEEYRRLLMAQYGLKKKDITVIPNGVDFEALQIYKKTELMRSKNRKLICFVGRLVNTKGVKELIEASAKLPKHAFVLFASVAPTIEKIDPTLLAMEQSVRTQNNIIWFKDYDQGMKWQIMKNADIGLMPSLHEPFGIVALEFMALGTPLIVSNRGGLKEFCHSKNATVINPVVDEIVEAVENHVRDDAKVVAALETAKSFNYEKIAGHTNQLYKEVIEKCR